MTSEAAVTAYVGAFVDELARSGVRDVVVSPGSRSTPLAMLAAAHPHLKVWIQVDERSAAYFALGMAKASRRSVAILCTSGTAAANYFPAVVEAYYGRVPLIVLTADRPHELRDVGAPQTIDQIGMYGTHVKWFTEMALPEASPAMLRHVRSVAGRAAATALAGPSGPVHLNFPLREPFIPAVDEPHVWDGGREGGPSEGSPFAGASHGKRLLDEAQLDRLADELCSVRRGLIVCGPQENPDFPTAVVRLAERLQFPILADPLSQLRYGKHNKRAVIDGYDAFLRDENVVKRYAPEAVIRFGAMPVSKAFLLYLQAHRACRYIVVEDDAGWREPARLQVEMVYADPVLFCEALSGIFDARKGRPRKTWLSDWLTLNRITQDAVRRGAAVEELFEGRVFAELRECLPEGTLLFVGNSMPVRDMDTFFMNSEKRIRTMANRGASGIDGVVSSALGASTSGVPVVLVLGDLSFYHDLNGLFAAKQYRLNVTVIVLNNDGGGIFSFLPQADHPEHFETLFVTPMGLDFSHAVRLYGGSYTSVDSWAQFRDALSGGLAEEGLSVIEVRTDRKRNADLHRVVWQSVSRALARGREAVFPQSEG